MLLCVCFFVHRAFSVAKRRDPQLAPFVRGSLLPKDVQHELLLGPLGETNAFACNAVAKSNKKAKSSFARQPLPVKTAGS